jgi:hypothetical protein
MITQSTTSPEIVEDANHENSKLSSTLSQESHRSETNNVDTDIVVVRGRGLFTFRMSRRF